jgi:hypothetical protein
VNKAPRKGEGSLHLIFMSERMRPRNAVLDSCLILSSLFWECRVGLLACSRPLVLGMPKARYQHYNTNLVLDEYQSRNQVYISVGHFFDSNASSLLENWSV